MKKIPIRILIILTIFQVIINPMIHTYKQMISYLSLIWFNTFSVIMIQKIEFFRVLRLRSPLRGSFLITVCSYLIFVTLFTYIELFNINNKRIINSKKEVIVDWNGLIKQEGFNGSDDSVIEQDGSLDQSKAIEKEKLIELERLEALELMNKQASEENDQDNAGDRDDSIMPDEDDYYGTGSDPDESERDIVECDGLDPAYWLEQEDGLMERTEPGPERDELEGAQECLMEQNAIPTKHETDPWILEIVEGVFNAFDEIDRAIGII